MMILATRNRSGAAEAEPSTGRGVDLAMPRLLIEDGTIIACLRRFDGSHTVIGRHPSSDLCLPFDPQISATHASITWVEELQAHVLNDLRSANGTFLDGFRMRQPEKLVNGARIRIGRTTIVYCCRLPIPGYVSTLARRVRPSDIVNS